MPPLVIHIFVPDRIQSDPTRRAAVRIADGFEPASGSVRPKHPTASPLAMRGSHPSFCSSLPYFQMGNMESDPWTETKDRNPLSPASSSMQARPYETALIPAHPYPERCIPNRPSEPSSVATSEGNSPRSNHPSMPGRTRSRTNDRTVSRTIRSSSDSSASTSRKSSGRRAARPGRVSVAIAVNSIRDPGEG